jgi:hypothetical protein
MENWQKIKEFFGESLVPLKVIENFYFTPSTNEFLVTVGLPLNKIFLSKAFPTLCFGNADSIVEIDGIKYLKLGHHCPNPDYDPDYKECFGVKNETGEIYILNLEIDGKTNIKLMNSSVEQLFLFIIEYNNLYYKINFVTNKTNYIINNKIKTHKIKNDLLKLDLYKINAFDEFVKNLIKIDPLAMNPMWSNYVSFWLEDILERKGLAWKIGDLPIEEWLNQIYKLSID